MSKASGVKEPESLTGNIDDKLPSGQGDDSSKSSREIENVMAENRRKAEEISSLKEKVSSYEDRLEQLEEKSRLTEREKLEKSALEDGLESAVQQLKSSKESRPWMKIAQEEGETAALKVSYNTLIEMANDFLDEQAELLGLKDGDELARSIAPYAPKGDANPFIRNKKAFREWNKAQTKDGELKKREAELQKKEAELKSFSEGRGRIPRDSSLATKISEAKTPADRLRLAVELQGESEPIQ